MRLLTPCVLATAAPVAGLAADKPRDRASAESHSNNVDRYKIGGFGANANATLGVRSSSRPMFPRA